MNEKFFCISIGGTPFTRFFSRFHGRPVDPPHADPPHTHRCPRGDALINIIPPKDREQKLRWERAAGAPVVRTGTFSDGMKSAGFLWSR